MSDRAVDGVPSDSPAGGAAASSSTTNVRIRLVLDVTGVASKPPVVGTGGAGGGYCEVTYAFMHESNGPKSPI